MLEVTERVIEATEKAEGKFWASIVESFPEAKTGDVDPLLVIKFHITISDAVREWVLNNVPGACIRDVYCRACGWVGLLSEAIRPQHPKSEPIRCPQCRADNLWYRSHKPGVKGKDEVNK
jgi:hypothetical protein